MKVKVTVVSWLDLAGRNKGSSAGWHQDDWMDYGALDQALELFLPFASNILLFKQLASRMQTEMGATHHNPYCISVVIDK